jgi:short-subunit dehydrogenase involved in D-alanine esterification of teichoic acids
MTNTPKSNYVKTKKNLDLSSPEAELEMRGLEIASQANGYVHELRNLTAQETNLVAGISMGLSKVAASKRAGMGVQKATTLLADASVQHHLEMLHVDRMDIASEMVKYDMVDAHLDIEQGKRMSANAMEWFRGVEMQMKLHGLAQDKQVIDVNVTSIQKVDQLAELDDAALLKLMGSSNENLLAAGHEVVDAEYVK